MQNKYNLNTNQINGILRNKFYTSYKRGYSIEVIAYYRGFTTGYVDDIINFNMAGEWTED